MKLRYLTISLCLGAAVGAFAQTNTPTPPAGGPRPGGPGRPGRGPRFHPIVRVIDADKDGTLSASELANAPTALKALDPNSDGGISADELHPPRPAGAPTPPADRPHPADPIMLALDADQDGTLNAQEIANATASLLALDLDKDGKLAPDEYRPLPPERPANE